MKSSKHTRVSKNSKSKMSSNAGLVEVQERFGRGSGEVQEKFG